MTTAQDTWQIALRPRNLAEYIGQRDAVSALSTAVTAARRGGWQLDHTLVTGPAGYGKTSLAAALAADLGTKLHTTTGVAIGHKGELASILTSMDEGDVLFIDEIHGLAPALQECLYTAMEDRRIDLFTSKGSKRNAISVTLPAFTLVGATTLPGRLTGPLRDRFGLHLQLVPYALEDLATIVARSAKLLGVRVSLGAATEIARRSRGTPRIANTLLRRARDFAVVTGAPDYALTAGELAVDLDQARSALDQLQIDELGLGQLDRAYLATVCARTSAAGVEAIASAIGTDRGTLEESVEPYLVQKGLVARTPRGRIATELGRAHHARALARHTAIGVGIAPRAPEMAA